MPEQMNFNSKWDDDSIQFPRLIAEILATQQLDCNALAESMDLEFSDLEELFNRAQGEWESIKTNTCLISAKGDIEKFRKMMNEDI